MKEQRDQVIKKDTPPSLAKHQGQTAAIKQPRSSNLELYRIICMLMIVAHHYVVNSGLSSDGGPLMTDFPSVKNIFLLFFGAWGKTGINCFLMITGYFMCTSSITIKKYLKLFLQVYLYKFVIFGIFLFTGYESLSFSRIVKLVMPFWGFRSGFVECYFIFYLTIPFWNILIKNLTKRGHQLLIVLILLCYTILGSLPTFQVSFNYITWFGFLYAIASYIRLYPVSAFERRSLWGWLTLVVVLLAMLSIVIMQKLFAKWDYFLADSNRFFAVLVATSSFLWFKNMNISYNKIINAFGAAAFGVLLIHANSKAMRTWLWKDTVDCVGHYYSLSTESFVLYSIGVVLAIFIICNLIDQFRIATVEKWFFNWYDNKVSAKADVLVNKILKK